MTELKADFEILEWALADMRPHPDNPRKHPKPGSPKWEALRKSLSADYFDPIKVNRRNGMIISGHLRRRIALEMGVERLPVMVFDYDEPTHKARMIAANTMLGQWEEEMLSQLARQLTDAGIDASLAGLTEQDMAALVDGPSTIDDSSEAEELMSKSEELQQRWQVRLGDLYQIGPHRLLCGDCSSPQNWRLLLNGRLVDAWWTDPPYNIAYDDLQRHRNEIKGREATQKVEAILNDDVTDAEYARLLKAWFEAAAKHSKPGATIYIAHADCYRVLNETAAEAAGFKIAQNLVWVKNSFTIGRQDYQWQHEPVLYGWLRGAKHYWQGGYNKATVIDDETDLRGLSKAELMAIISQMRNERLTTVARHPRNSGNGLHPTIKPLGLVADHIWNSSRIGETVGELFGGSGTTLAACEQIGRHCCATELDPKYCAVILERMKAYGLPIEKIHEHN